MYTLYVTTKMIPHNCSINIDPERIGAFNTWPHAYSYACNVLGHEDSKTFLIRKTR